MDTVFVKLTWDAIDEYCDKLAHSILKSKQLPDMIIAVGRGGLIPARILSDRLSIKSVYMYNIKMYTGVNQKQAKPTLEFFNHCVVGRNILLVDDILDSGTTIETVINDIKSKRAQSVRTATLICKKKALRKPTFCVSMCEDNHWIIFPWEKKEFLITKK